MVSPRQYGNMARGMSAAMSLILEAYLATPSLRTAKSPDAKIKIEGKLITKPAELGRRTESHYT